jgi:hypothetical protein
MNRRGFLGKLAGLFVAAPLANKVPLPTPEPVEEAFPGVVIEVASGSCDTTALKVMMENYYNGLQRYLALSGISVKRLDNE